MTSKLIEIHLGSLMYFLIVIQFMILAFILTGIPRKKWTIFHKP